MRKIVLTLSCFLFAMPLLYAQIRIKMHKENGVYTTPCNVNGLKLHFIFDTGASNVSLSISEAVFMLKNGYLNESDLHGSSYAQIANGDIVKNTTVILKELEIGGIILHNVEAIIIHETSAPLLLGQSAIQKLGSIQLEDDELIILQAESSSDQSCPDAIKLLKDADSYFDMKLYSLSAETFNKAHDLCSLVFNWYEFYYMGLSYYYSNSYTLAIKYFEKSLNYTDDKEEQSRAYSYIGNSYIETSNFSNAILNLEKALAITTDNKYKSYYNADISTIYRKQNKFYEAIDYLKKSIDYYLLSLSITEIDVKRGRVENQILGGYYWTIGILYNKLYLDRDEGWNMAMAAMCGHEKAIKFLSIKYDRDPEEVIKSLYQYFIDN